MFYAAGPYVYYMVFTWYSDLILHTNKHKDTQRHTAHLGASRLNKPYKYTFTPPVMCSQQLSLSHNTDRNGVHRQNTQTHTKYSEKDNTKIG